MNDMSLSDLIISFETKRAMSLGVIKKDVRKIIHYEEE